MQTWPTITIQHRRLALPQVAKTLNRYVTGIVKLNPQERTAQLLKLFADDPFFTTWVHAQAAARGSPGRWAAIGRARRPRGPRR